MFGIIEISLGSKVHGMKPKSPHSRALAETRTTSIQMTDFSNFGKCEVKMSEKLCKIWETIYGN